MVHKNAGNAGLWNKLGIFIIVIMVKYLLAIFSGLPFEFVFIYLNLEMRIFELSKLL